jgi:hypothetical protein
MQSSISHSFHIYLWPGASIGQAVIGTLLSTHKPCCIRGPVYTIQSVAYLEFMKGGPPVPSLPYLPLLPHPSIFPYLPLSCPTPSFPSIPPFQGSGLLPRKKIYSADAHRRALAHSGDQNLLSDTVDVCQCDKV